MRPALDFYDDRSGSLLKEVFPERSNVPAFIKEAVHVPTEFVHDSDFALVLLEGEGKLRKFATVDPGNTFLSTLYFLDRGHLLTKEARMVAASRLVEACDRHRLNPPEALIKCAAEGIIAKAVEEMSKRPSTAASTLADKIDTPKGEGKGEENRKAMDEFLGRGEVGGQEIDENFREVQAPEAKDDLPKVAMDLVTLLTTMQASGIQPELAESVLIKLKQGMQPSQEEGQALSQIALQIQQNPTILQKITPMAMTGAQRELGILQEGQRAMAERTQGWMPEQSLLASRLAKISSGQGGEEAPEAVKESSKAGLVGDVATLSVMGLGAGSMAKKKKPVAPAAPAAPVAPVKQASPYVEFGFDDRPRVKRSEGVRTLLSGRYPVDTYSQVEKAAEYFDKHGHMFHPRDRRTYCVNLVKRASEIGAEHVIPGLAKYAGEGFGAHFNMQMVARRQVTPEQFVPALDHIKEASTIGMPPEVVVRALEQLDKKAGMDQHWGSAIEDPWATVYGLEKKAEFEEETTDGDRVTERDLKELCLNGLHRLKDQFDHKFVHEFQKSPVTVFKSLPDPVKTVIGRMCADLHAA